MLKAIMTTLALASFAIATQAAATPSSDHDDWCGIVEEEAGCDNRWAPWRGVYCVCDWDFTIPSPCAPEHGLCSEMPVCEAVGDGHYLCPSEGAYLEPATADEEVTLHVFDPAAKSGDGWDCDGGWCRFDFGLVSEDDDVPLPGQGAQCDETAPETCEPDPDAPEPAPPQGSTGSAGSRRRPIFIRPGNADQGCGWHGDDC